MRKSRRKNNYHRAIRHHHHISFLKFIFSLVGLAMLLVAARIVYTTVKETFILGTYIAKGGDDTSGSGSSGSDSSGSGGENSSGSSRDESQSSNGSGGSSGSGSDNLDSERETIEPTDVKTRSSTGVRTFSKTTTDKQETEVRLSESERIRVRTKDDRTRIDLTSGGVKVRFELRDDRTIIKAEKEDGEEVELEDEAFEEIEDRLAEDDIEIEATESNKFLFRNGTVNTLSDFPISINLATNALFINTPSGQKQVAVLPEQAIQNLLSNNIVDRIAIINPVQEAEVELVEKENQPVLKVEGFSDKKLLGFVPLAFHKLAILSAETGKVIEIEESLIDRILEIASI